MNKKVKWLVMAGVVVIVAGLYARAWYLGPMYIDYINVVSYPPRDIIIRDGTYLHCASTMEKVNFLPVYRQTEFVCFVSRQKEGI